MQDQALEGAEQAAEPDETSEEDTDEQPAIDDDEFADVDLDAVAEQAEEEAGADAGDDDAAEETDEQAASDADSDSSSGGKSWGDMYVGTLTTFTNEVIEEHGKEDAETIDESLARELYMDEYMDDLREKHGKAKDMPPEQALLLSTSMFLVVVLGTKTDLPSQLLEEFDF